MAFDSLTEFFAMGGHGAYVWAAWGATGLLLIVLVIHARLEQRKALQMLRRRFRREQQHAASVTVSSDTLSERGHTHERQA
ncbi:heme exporter protein CcmD [Halomonas halocynthiae]|uniref:heme exporter protein CcmD n=1 Tax=Halomonas halocynthiae TaxID=176290 RepID=UPI00040EA58D|nr:heme exporter protein CcmD [Halomonas halocynthiae]